MRNLLQTYLQSNIGFYAYKQPDNDAVHISTIKKAASVDYADLLELNSQDAFVVFPFDDRGAKGWCFSADKQNIFNNYSKEVNIARYNFNSSDQFSNGQFKEYGKQFDLIMQAIKSGKVQKVILSKTVHVKNSKKINLGDVFLQLINLYPKTFVFLVSSPETGIWMGASPELLFSKNAKVCTTVSLAGTRPRNDAASSWTEKEIDEQKMVSTFIDNALEKHHIKTYKKTGPNYLKVGNLTHLKTIYQFDAPSNFDWASFVKTLHPTPALCGEPKLEAMQLISEVESHKREYYGGFLGIISKKDVSLYVNLRSMKIADNESIIYVGGGLTNQSNLTNEWEELKLKSKILLSAL